jgi:hypothetical protein
MAGAAALTFLAEAAIGAPVTARSSAIWENPLPDEASQIYALDYLQTMNADGAESWMQWGAPCIGVDCSTPSASGQSRLAYLGQESGGDYGAPLRVGSFTFENRDNYSNTQFAQVDFTLSFIIETPGGVFAEAVPLTLAVMNTPNTPGRESEWADYLDFRSPGADPLTRSYIGADGALYAIRISGFSAIENLRVDEGGAGSAFVFAQVDRQAAPIAGPGGLALFLLAATLTLIGRARAASGEGAGAAGPRRP